MYQRVFNYKFSLNVTVLILIILTLLILKMSRTNNADVTTTFINLCTYSKFEEKLFQEYSRLNLDRELEGINKNNFYRKLFIEQPEWSGYKNDHIITLDSNSQIENKIEIGRYADVIFNFLLNFENCDKEIINKIQFMVDDKVIDELSLAWIDIYKQMYNDKIESENNLIIPSYHFRNYLPNIISDPKTCMKIILNKELQDDQKIRLFSKMSCLSDARRRQIKNIPTNFFYDRIVSKVYKPTEKNTLEILMRELWYENFSNDADKEALSSLSEIFISVKKKPGFNHTDEVIKNLTLSFGGALIYKDQPSNFYKNVNPLLCELNPSEENTHYQGHYLIPFSNICKQENDIKEWQYRGGVNMNKLTNVSMDILLNDNIPVENYEIELTYVCPTFWN